jgi:hypothetical protein
VVNTETTPQIARMPHPPGRTGLARQDLVRLHRLSACRQDALIVALSARAIPAKDPDDQVACQDSQRPTARARRRPVARTVSSTSWTPSASSKFPTTSAVRWTPIWPSSMSLSGLAGSGLKTKFLIWIRRSSMRCSTRRRHAVGLTMSLGRLLGCGQRMAAMASQSLPVSSASALAVGHV